MDAIVINIVIAVVSFGAGFGIATSGMKQKLEALQDEYNTLVDRDPKTGRFVKSMRKLKHDN